MENLENFKEETKTWKIHICPCSLCKVNIEGKFLFGTFFNFFLSIVLWPVRKYLAVGARIV